VVTEETLSKVLLTCADLRTQNANFQRLLEEAKHNYAELNADRSDLLEENGKLRDQITKLLKDLQAARDDVEQESRFRERERRESQIRIDTLMSVVAHLGGNC
jgi:hypothetical protein